MHVGSNSVGSLAQLRNFDGEKAKAKAYILSLAAVVAESQSICPTVEAANTVAIAAL